MGKVKKAGAARKKLNNRSKGTNSRAKARKKPAAKKAVARKPEVKPTYNLRELDPVKKCGAGTSVQLLYRVDERTGNVVRPHLVFFDRHGWYCEHGRNCSAVSHALRDAKRNHAQLVLAYEKLDRLKTAG